MNKKLPNRNQAKKLRQRVEHEVFEEGQVISREDLPPRSRVHQQKGKKNKWKVKYPVIRLLVLFFILLPVTIFSIYSTIAERKGNVKETISESTDGFEVIDIERPDPAETEEQEIQEEAEEKEESTPKFNYEVTEKESDEEHSEQEGNESVLSVESLIEEKESKPAPKNIIYHTVQPGETIYRISIKYYQSDAGIETIKSVNNLNSNEIRVGQVLTIPLTK